MAYDPIAIANHFVKVARERGSPISPMKLQKLVFYAHGWYFSLTNSPLINTQVEAWAYGPVIRRVYSAFRKYGNRPVEEEAKISKFFSKADGTGIRLQEVTPSIEDDPNAASFTRQLLDKIWEVYGGYSPAQLSNATHQPGTPWALAVETARAENGGVLPKGTDISARFIKDYFSNLAEPGSGK